MPDDDIAGGTETTPPAEEPKRRSSRKGKLKALTEELERAREEREQLSRTVQELTERVEQLQDERLRVLAEMDNMRKRTLRRLEEDRLAVIAEIARPLLDIADNLDRAVQTARDQEVAEGTLEGLRMIHSQLLGVLARYGVTPIEAVGTQFDYNLHEAVAHVPAEGKRESEVISEVSKGFLLNGRLLRPSKVIVARTTSQPEE